MRFTDEAYRQYFYRHWDWMAETGAALKKHYDAVRILREQTDDLDRNLKITAEHQCFACGAANRSFSDDDCVNCPIYTGIRKCFYDYSEYKKWESAATKKDRQKYARQISQLPWRGKSREQWEKEDRGE